MTLTNALYTASSHTDAYLTETSLVFMLDFSYGSQMSNVRYYSIVRKQNQTYVRLLRSMKTVNKRIFGQVRVAM